jgi:lipopolysaccharide export LptBFGC system permease protein LptF
MSNLTQSVEYKNDENINEINNTIEKQNEKQVVTKSKTCYYSNVIYFIFHILMIFVAFYLSYKCNRTFHISSFLVAFFCPYIYIIGILARYGKCDKLVAQFAEEAAIIAKAKATNN